jgi:hypothetical protein
MPTIGVMNGPGTVQIIDDAAAAITAQSLAVTGALGAGFGSIITQIGNAEVPGTILACLAEINGNLTRIADADQSISKGISDLNIAIGTMSAAMSENNSIMAISAANQIQTNNFQAQVTKDALARAGIPEPIMPPLKDQLKEAVTGGLTLNTVSVASGAVTQFVKSSVTSTAIWIAETTVYQTAAGFLSKAKDSILSILPPSVQSALSKAKTGKLV